MIARSFKRGWLIEFRGSWIYADTGEPVATERACRLCGRFPVDGHDPCLGHLPGIKSACCGHGIHESFVMEGWMGKRAGRRLTRKVKIANPQVAAKGEILRGIEVGESLRHIADRIRMKCPIDKDRALKIVMAEFDKVMDADERRLSG